MAAPRNPHRRPKLTEDAVRVIRAIPIDAHQFCDNTTPRQNRQER